MPGPARTRLVRPASPAGPDGPSGPAGCPSKVGNMRSRPRVGVSSCLLGEEVRFNGGHKRYRFLTDELGPYVDWVPYCPEVSIGLGTPREAIRLTADRRLVNPSGIAHHTEAIAGLFLAGARLDG